MLTAVVIPVKDLTSAKQRLSAALSLEQRRALAAAMLDDVLETVGRASVDLLWVVTQDEEVIAKAARHGATIVREVENRGHSHAVAIAQARALAQHVDAFLTIPGDVPLVSANEIGRLLDAARAVPGAILVPSRSGLGTNGALLTPPGLMPLTFGEPSFSNHVERARKAGVEPLILRLPGLGLDVDAPEDLETLAREGGDCGSARLAQSLVADAPGAWA